MIALVVSVALVCATVIVLQRGYVPPVEVPVPSLLEQRKKVVATLKSGTAFVGVLYSADSDVLVLRQVTLIREGHDPVPADGEVLILRADLDYLQLP